MRVIRGLAALVALTGGLFGVPVLLLALTRQLWTALSAWSDPLALLTGPDPLVIMITLLFGVAWVAWLIFTLGALSELVGLVSGRQIRLRLPGVPGLAATQRLAAGLFVSVIAMVSTAQLSSAELPPREPRPEPISPHSSEARLDDDPASAAAQPPRRAVEPPATSTPATPGTTKGDDVHVHVVELGDDLWSLAQRYYGRGTDWRRIAAANPSRLSGGPDRLDVGWKLRIPGVEPDSDRERKRGRTSNRANSDEGERTVVVQPGDTLSAIAQRAYGAERRWPVLWRANRFQLDDPDELLIGMRLVVPGARTRATKAVSKDRAKTEPEDQPVKNGDGTSTAGVPKVKSKTPASAPQNAPAESPPAGPEPSPTQVPDQTSKARDGADSSTSSGDHTQLVVAGLAAAGALLSASLIAGLAARRRLQLQARPLGRRILHPPVAGRTAEVVMGHRARPLGLRTLDLATRAIGAHCHHGRSPLPCLTIATVSDDHLELHWTEPAPQAPPGFRADGSRWLLDAADVGYLKTVPGLGEAARPFPALVTLGQDEAGRPVVGDLETLGLLRLHAEDPALVEAALTAMALELSFSPWAEEMILTLVGTLPQLPAALGRHNVTSTDDVDALLDRLEARAAVQREQQSYEIPGQHRVDPDLADPWAPEIVLINKPLAAAQDERLRDLLSRRPRVTMAAVLPGARAAEHEWSLILEPPGPELAQPSAALEPAGVILKPQLIEAPAAAALVELVAATGSEQTTPAPWWPAPDPAPPPDNVTYLGPSTKLHRLGGWATRTEGETGEMDFGAGDDRIALHPTLRLLGPVDLIGAAGPAPSRAARQCLEYCGWLLENPGATAHRMAVSLVVAEGTRRSNMSRLRTWLGTADDGSAFLPDAYSGRIQLHNAVSSDWQRLQIFTAHGVNQAGTTALRSGLELVRGAPLADAAPGQWHWAEELRTDMISAVRDIGAELARRALEEDDIDLARWAAARALAAAPGDELLLVARIRTEDRAGNRAEVERLTLQLAAQARQLGVDLAPETVTVLQEAMEGRVRARLA